MTTASGRTGRILGKSHFDCRTWYVKENPSARVNQLEYRLYQALAQDPTLQRAGVSMPAVQLGTEETILFVEDQGKTLSNALHTPGRYTDFDFFATVLKNTLAVRGVVRDVINRTLTDDDKTFLYTDKVERLRGSMQKIAPGQAFDLQEVVDHYWAYRAMNALGGYNEQFKQWYTECVGARIERFMPRYGSWLTDNCLRNNAVDDQGNVVPFDFNSIGFGLKQMDEAGIVGLYIFDGPLGQYSEPEKRDEILASLSAEDDSPDDSKEAFLLSCVHQNVLLAGYRTQEAKAKLRELEAIVATGKLFTRSQYQPFKTAFDEIDYHHAAGYQALQWLKEGEEDAQVRYALDNIKGVFTHYTFGQRTPMMLSKGFRF